MNYASARPVRFGFLFSLFLVVALPLTALSMWLCYLNSCIANVSNVSLQARQRKVCASFAHTVADEIFHLTRPYFSSMEEQDAFAAQLRAAAENNKALPTHAALITTIAAVAVGDIKNYGPKEDQRATAQKIAQNIAIDPRLQTILQLYFFYKNLEQHQNDISPAEFEHAQNTLELMLSFSHELYPPAR